MMMMTSNRDDHMLTLWTILPNHHTGLAKNHINNPEELY